MGLEELIDFAQVLGFRVNNLIEMEDGSWRANVHGDEDAYEFGEGQTHVDALTEALRKAGVDL